MYGIDDDLEYQERKSYRVPLNWFLDPSDVVGEERVERYVHNFKAQSNFGTKGTLRQCRYVFEAAACLTEEEFTGFCEQIEIPENSPTFDYMIGVGRQWEELRQSNFWWSDWLALYVLSPAFEREELERIIRMGRFLEGKNSNVIRDALASYSANDEAE